MKKLNHSSADENLFSSAVSRVLVIGRSFWSMGYWVRTVDLDEKGIREYKQLQEKLHGEEEQTASDFNKGPIECFPHTTCSVSGQ